MNSSNFQDFIKTLYGKYPDLSNFLEKTCSGAQQKMSLISWIHGVKCFVDELKFLFDEIYIFKMLWELFVGDICFMNHVGGPHIVPTKDLAKKTRKRTITEISAKSYLPYIFLPNSLTMTLCETFCVYEYPQSLRKLLCYRISMHTLNIYLKYTLKLDTLVINKPIGKLINFDKDLNFPKSLRHLFLINCGDKIININFKKLLNLNTLCIVGLPLSPENVNEILKLEELNSLYLENCGVEHTSFNGCNIPNVIIS
jgi:hypothetical protein